MLVCHINTYSLLCQAKIHQQEHLILKRSMQLSSAMATEIVSPALLARLEDNLDVDLSGLAHHQFRPNTWLQTIVKSDIGFLQLVQGGQEGVSTDGVEEVVKWDASSKGLEVKLSDKTEDIKEDRRRDVVTVTGESASGLEDVSAGAMSGDRQYVTVNNLPKTGTVSPEVVKNKTDLVDDADDDTVVVTQEVTSRLPSPGTTAVVSPIKPHLDPVSVSDFPPGSSCLALWTEDNVWYRARVNSVTEDRLQEELQELYQVTFIDYGNTVTVSQEQMVARIEDIPKEQLEMVDHLVWKTDGGPSKWSVDMSCIAKWSEDHTWYNGVVTAVLGGGQYTMVFIDYLNMEVVSEQSMVETARDIPAGESVDLCVEREDTANNKESGIVLEEFKECLMENARENEGQSVDRLEGTDERKDVEEEEHADNPLELEARILDISDSCSTPQDLKSRHINNTKNC